jgi:hypothetical protein
MYKYQNLSQADSSAICIMLVGSKYGPGFQTLPDSRISDTAMGFQRTGHPSLSHSKVQIVGCNLIILRLNVLVCSTK